MTLPGDPRFPSLFAEQKPSGDLFEHLKRGVFPFAMKTTANFLGWFSVTGNLLFWSAIFNPFGWRGFHGDIMLTGLGLLLSLIASMVASFKASRWWALCTVISIVSLAVFELALK